MNNKDQTIAIMQPYFLPYIGYWQLLNAVDVFVIYDDVQFIQRGWIHRNNILINHEKSRFTLPLEKADRDTLINQRKLASTYVQEREKLVKKIQYAYAKAPYYDQVMPMIEACFLYDDLSLSHFVFNSMKLVADYLKMNTSFVFSSTLKVDLSLARADRLIAICKQQGAFNYINAEGGKALYDKEAFAAQGVTLSFLATGDITYQQFNKPFVPNLSIIDVLMFNDVDTVRSMLSCFELV